MSTSKAPSWRDFARYTDHFQLGQDAVARVCFLMLRDHPRITPPRLRSAVLELWGGSDGRMTWTLLRDWLLRDNWIHYSPKPFAGGRGMGSEPAYDRKEQRWEEFCNAR